MTSLWDLYFADDIQRAAQTWPIERFFTLIADKTTKFEITNMQGAPKYFDIKLSGLCQEGEPATVYFTLKLPGLTDAEKATLYEALRRAHPGKTRKDLAIKRWAAKTLGIPLRA